MAESIYAELRHFGNEGFALRHAAPCIADEHCNMAMAVTREHDASNIVHRHYFAVGG